MIVSAEQWRDSAIHIHVSFLPQTPFPSRLPELRLFLYLKIFESVQVPYAFYWINSWIICNKACSVQFSWITQSCLTLCNPINRSMPGLPVYHQLLESTLMSIESVMPSNHVILCHPLLLLPPIPSSIRVFSNESTLHMRWPKYWSFNFSVSPSNEHLGLIFRMDWLDLLAVQGTLRVFSNATAFYWINSWITCNKTC